LIVIQVFDGNPLCGKLSPRIPPPQKKETEEFIPGKNPLCKVPPGNNFPHGSPPHTLKSP